EGTAGLQQQRGLADPRIAPDEDEGALDDAAPEHAVQLADARGHALSALDADLAERERAVRADARHAQAAARRGRAFLDELDEVAGARAVRARPGLGRGQPALLAAVHGPLPGH